MCLSLTIALETGDIGRFAKVGNYASYCRCASSEWLSNGKRKGRGNTKNGNKWLAWAFVEAANFTVPLFAGGQALLPAKDGEDQAHRGDQGGGKQVGPGFILRDAGRNAVRAEALLRLSGQVATASHEKGLAQNHQN